MSRRMRIYYYAILGALGGLFGWQIVEWLGFVGGQNVYLSDALLGGAIGVSVGLLIGLAEGLSSRSVLRGLRAGLISGLFGLAAGVIALPASEWVFLTLGQIIGVEVVGRAVGWAIFGLFLGLAQGVTGGTQMWKGALGGVIGGTVGGVILELTRLVLGDPLVGKALGLVILGGCVGIFIALIVVLLSRAWLEVTSGKLLGTEFILDKFMGLKSPAAFIGSSVLKCDIALTDPEVEPQHAQLKGADTHFVLEDRSLKKGTFVNDRRIQTCRLANRDRIRVGDTELTYHERR